MNYLVRVGVLGQVGCFRSNLLEELQYGDQVVCRTDRGLEIGQLLGPATSDYSSDRISPGHDTDGPLLRRLTAQDQLLSERLNRNRNQAIEACQRLIEENRFPVVLMDAEQTFDGKHLYFYFLGEITPEVDAMTSRLASKFDSVIRFSEFAETLAKGCGPDCGTAEKSGCGSGGCSNCSLASRCKS